MITENELRIGNHILLNGKIDTVTGIFHELSEDRNKKFDVFIQAANDLDYKLEDCSEVLLTPEILEKCGFEQEGTEAGDDGALELGNTHYEKKICFLWIPKKGKYMGKEAVGLWIGRHYGDQQLKIDKRQVKYLHQLQNLYFSLTGTELNIEL